MMATPPQLLPYQNCWPRIGKGSLVLPGVQIVGDVEIGEECSIWFNSVLRGDVFPIRIGNRVNIQDLSMVHVTTDKHMTWIGDDVTIGHRVVLHGCRLEGRLLVGMDSVIMDEAIVEEDCMIGAGSLVTPGTRVPRGHLALGRPARVIRPLRPEEVAEIHRLSGHYMNIARNYTEDPVYRGCLAESLGQG